MACSKMCGLKRNLVIVRPSEGYFTECGSLTKFRWSDKYLQHLSESCKDGDHYFAAYIDFQAHREKGSDSVDGGSAAQPQGGNDQLFFYVITTNVCQQFTSLTGNDIAVGAPFRLDAKCQGGQFYFAKGRSFFIVKGNQYLETTDISEGAFGDDEPEWRNLPRNLQNATYFFATSDSHYIVKNEGDKLMLSTRTIIQQKAGPNDIENAVIEGSLCTFLLRADTEIKNSQNMKPLPQQLDDALKSDEQCRGLAVIVACPGNFNGFVHGVLADYEKAIATFTSLNFAVVPLLRATVSDIGAIIEAIRTKKEYPETCKALVVLFSGHGISEQICAEDGDLKIEENIVQPLSDVEGLVKITANEKLVRMPKLFFIDACRGDKTHGGIYMKRNGVQQNYNKAKFLPGQGNYLIGYATRSSFVAKACAEGSFWIRTLLEELQDPRNKTVTVCDVLTTVNARVVSEMAELRRRHSIDHLQQPIIVSALCEHLYLQQKDLRLQKGTDQLTGAFEQHCVLLDPTGFVAP